MIAARRRSAQPGPCDQPLRRRVGLALAVSVSIATQEPAAAEDLGEWGGFDIRWDTTVRLSLGLRTEPANPQLLSKINADDGDRAFVPGPNSERVDVITELTGERGSLGFDISAQGWYDAAYNTDSANNSPATFNPITSSNRGFPGDVRTLMGRDAELLNAYVHDTADVGDVPVTLSVGRQTLLWGESLLFPENGIAAAQAPVDEIKALSAPLAEARELFLPVAQVVVRAGLGNGFSLEAYDQLEWRRNRLPGVGSFFSTSDILDVGGQRFLAADGLPTMYRTADAVPYGVGQFGLALRHSDGVTDWGLYALRADARSPTVVFEPANLAYHLAFPSGIQVYGASVSTYAGDANLAGEISVHRNTPLDTDSGLGPASSLGSGYVGGIVSPRTGGRGRNRPGRGRAHQPSVRRSTRKYRYRRNYHPTGLPMAPSCRRSWREINWSPTTSRPAARPSPWRRARFSRRNSSRSGRGSIYRRRWVSGLGSLGGPPSMRRRMPARASSA